MDLQQELHKGKYYYVTNGKAIMTQRVCNCLDDFWNFFSEEELAASDVHVTVYS
jgi:hypothetical protein